MNIRTKSICAVEGCSDFVKSHGLCNKHMLRMIRNGSVDVVKRNHKNKENDFWNKVNKTNSCWLWTGPVFKTGYGSFSNSKGNTAHRYSYQIHKGDIPEGMYILHHCDNRLCVNPDHLFAGTCDYNLKDMAHKQRHGRAKLTKELANEIKDKYLTGRHKQRDLAKQYGITQSTLQDIIHNKTWKHSRFEYAGL